MPQHSWLKVVMHSNTIMYWLYSDTIKHHKGANMVCRMASLRLC